MAIRIISRKCTQAVCFMFLMVLLFCVCEGQDSSSLSPMDEKEKQVVYNVIQGFVGKWWNGSDLYPDPCGWTPIQGVSCELYDDGFWYVTVVNLGQVFDNSLICSNDAKFPEQLFKLKHLKVLSLTSCFLSPNKNPVTLPISGWEKFSESLESLILRSNPGLVGTIPSTIGSLRSLQSLVLLENSLTGELPRSIGNLVKLRQLVLAGNNLVGSLPPIVGSWSSLLKLDLSNNVLEGLLPMELGRLKHLTLLDVSHNKLIGGLAETIKELVSLKDMVLSNNPIGGDLLGTKWRSFTKVETLDLSNMGLEGSVPESITEMKRLRFLDLSNNNLNGSLSRNLENLPCLKALHVNGNNLTGRLEFSQEFYGKLGRRFAAWNNNENLCYVAKQVTPVPYSVKPCLQEITNSEGVSTVENFEMSEGSYDEDSFVETSFGISSFVFNDVWLILSVNVVLTVLLWNLSF
ncbi:piriformospora indica-insensitive protein 2-like isoform X2 [Arachis duranensis]|uniref:Piriformospora indica-insensitive protein 2-like isoform X2 n=1 Tax=Arachis duranensis TaxID=130453 RepID=A0A9C6WLK0_ARADU|nr:piriformospora indica-insensitive protein 2-like isoform X2 [Arachis duranensis]